MNRRRRISTKKKKISKRKPRKWSIKKARMISKKRYQMLLTKYSVKKKKLTLNEKKQLERALFVNYCKCIKKIKYKKNTKKGIEYPICNTSIYKNRGYKVPSGIKIKCRDYY